MKQLLILSAVASLSGCGMLFGDDGIFRDSSEDYLNAEPLAVMQVPEGLDSDRLHELYAIPEIDEDNLELLDSSDTPRPMPLSALQQDSSVKIQKLFGKRWILASAGPSEVWPRVRNFLNVTGLVVESADAPQGLIETAWLQFKNDPDHKDKYRIRLEQGVQLDSTEIHIRHVSFESAAADAMTTIQWPEVSTNAEREGWMVDELAGAIAADMKLAGSSSLLAQTIAGQDKVVLHTTGVEPVLVLQLDFNRTWATVRHSLTQEGFTLWDENDGRRVFYVHYEQPKPEDDEEPGFFARWFGSNERKVPTSTVSLNSLLKKLPENILESKAGDSDLPGYLVVLTQVDNSVEVRIRNTKAGALAKKDAKRLLAVIRRNLI